MPPKELNIKKIENGYLVTEVIELGSLYGPRQWLAGGSYELSTLLETIFKLDRATINEETPYATPTDDEIPF